ncbi:MAG: hypothetical protein RMM53_08895, partial [Bacteroidia bacterium]|nr:hypothetical protein [Bacteroidia bacterium]
ARLFMCLYAFFALTAVYFTARKTYEDSGRKDAIALWAVALTAFTSQFSVYGSQTLGEVPALGWMLWGLYFLETRPAIAGTCFGFAGLCKEYTAVPLAAMLLFHAIKKSFKSALTAGAIAGTLVALYYASKFDDMDLLADYWRKKSGYGREFLAFDFSEPLRFLAFKPLILLGSVALIYRNTPNLTVLHTALSVCFLISAGYDRFGLWLIPGAAVGIAPFARFFFEKRPLATALVVLLLFVQKTPFLMIQRILYAPNEEEKRVATFVRDARVFTYELPLVLFAAKVRLPRHPPALSHLEPPPVISSDEYFVAGPYAQTEYTNYAVSPDWVRLFRCNQYDVYANRRKR